VGLGWNVSRLLYYRLWPHHLAELIANCWDAGATKVDIRLPESSDYDPATSQITITDDGVGMSDGQVEKRVCN
jgi:DNA mismatch repair ATPase MutL